MVLGERGEGEEISFGGESCVTRAKNVFLMKNKVFIS
jgi:hypothetical protein